MDGRGSEFSKQAKQFCRERRCFLCCNTIPEGRGMYWAGGRILLCNEPRDCHKVLDSLLKDYSRSKRGKWRPRTEVLRLIAERRKATGV